MKRVLAFVFTTFCYFLFFNSAVAQTETPQKVVVVIEQNPEFPGGENQLWTYIMKNLKYPKSARKDSIQGKVVVKFLVTGEGLVNQVTIVEGVRDDLDTEAIRLVKNMPKWKPGKQNSKPVDVWFELPITFSLN